MKHRLWMNGTVSVYVGCKQRNTEQRKTLFILEEREKKTFWKSKMENKRI